MAMRLTAIHARGTERVFAPAARVLRPPSPPQAAAEELLERPGGGFLLLEPQRGTLAPPTGTFNFVRIQEAAPRSRPLLASAQLAHAQLAARRPVIYAGTARFERGEMTWWSNYSGTYQPIAAFRAQAGLPEEKFVPWQRLVMGGTAMQRGTFTARKDQPAPVKPDVAAADGKRYDPRQGDGGRPGGWQAG